MLSITPAEHAAWQSGTQKNLTLVFDINGTTKTLGNSDIVSESMSLRQTVSDDASNVFGNVYSSEFSVRVFDDGTRYKGATLTVTISVTLENVDGYLVDSNGNRIVDSNGNYLIVNTDEDVTYTRQLGVFEVVSDKLTSDGISRDLVCYDSLSAVLKEDYSGWHNNLSFPTTLKNYRTAFFAYLGIAQENITLPNDSITVNKNNMSTVSGATIISAILGLNGCWGYIGMDNVFHYALPKTTADYVITDNSFVQGSYAFEEFQTAEYSGIIFTNNITKTITETDPDTGETTTYEETSEQNVTVGDSSGSVLNFNDNIFLVGKTDAELTDIGNALLTALDGFTYTPSAVSFPPYIGLELGDVFQITTEKGTYSFPVFDRTLSGITALRDVFTARGVEFSSENANSFQTFMAQYQSSLANVQDLTNKTNKLANELNISGESNQYFWHTESSIYYLTQDTEIDTSKTYYELSGTVYVVVTPTGTENPSEEGWYEAYADTGSHITEIPKEDFISDPENGGGNLLARSNGIAVRNGLKELARFGAETVIGDSESSDQLYYKVTNDSLGFSAHSIKTNREITPFSATIENKTIGTTTRSLDTTLNVGQLQLKGNYDDGVVLHTGIWDSGSIETASGLKIKAGTNGALANVNIESNNGGAIYLDGKTIFDHIYPVGSIYMSVNSTNPGTLFGGTWVQLKDKFLLGAGDTYSNGATGGNASVSYTPGGTIGNTTLTVNQIPSHQHGVVKWKKGTTTTQQNVGWYASDAGSGSKWQILSGSDGNQTYDCGTTATGGSKAHNHGWTGTKATIATMPPYLVVYMWKRTA